MRRQGKVREYKVRVEARGVNGDREGEGGRV